jgi:hypothetical protein
LRIHGNEATIYSAANEESFRHGFSQGVQRALDAVDARLSDTDKQKLQKWKFDIVQWRGPIGRPTFEAPKAPELDGYPARP